MLRSIPARIAVAGGGLGLGLTVLNQVIGNPAGAPLPPALERAGVLASLLAVVLMLVGLLWERIEPVAPERVALTGREGLELAEALPPSLRRELAWGSQMLLTATPAATVLLLWRGQVLLRRGLLGAGAFTPGAICHRASQQGRAISLVDLRLYPGRSEFDSLLEGLPAVLVQPLGMEGWLLLGGWSARCFSRSDLLWVEGWARRLTDELVPVPAVPEPESVAEHCASVPENG
ncbi:MAG: cofactor assembly of complex C subunit B [Synechococcaceae cyanobacterium]|nr:cofactor assembly of complex C subunit B [Synechococcaceae cyanobacterium]